MKAIGLNILLDDCERKVVISGDLAISYDEMDRMNLALMGIRHRNLAVDKLQNVWVRSFVKQQDDVHQCRNLMGALGY